MGDDSHCQIRGHTFSYGGRRIFGSHGMVDCILGSGYRGLGFLGFWKMVVSLVRRPVGSAKRTRQEGFYPSKTPDCAVEEHVGLEGIAPRLRVDFGAGGCRARRQVFSRPALGEIPIDGGIFSLGRPSFCPFFGHQTWSVVKPAPLFFDLDHTLWDFESNSRHALRQGYNDLNLAGLGVVDCSTWIQAYEKANSWCWSEYRHGRMDKETLRAERFRMALEAVKADPSLELAAALGEHYIATSPFQTALMEGALEVLEALSLRGHDMWLLTNGFDEVQHIKVANSGLKRFFRDVYTSDSLGVKKPHPEAFEKAAARAGLAMDSGVVMVGDSWESDVEGAQNVGWRGVHFNPHGEKNPLAWRTVRFLRELLELPLTV